MTRKADEKEVVNAIVDAELELQELVERIKAEGSVATDQLMAMVRSLIRAPGLVSKHALREAFRYVFLARYVRIVESLQKHTDRNLAEQVKAIKKFGRPISEIEAVVEEDLKQRISEKALG